MKGTVPILLPPLKQSFGTLWPTKFYHLENNVHKQVIRIYKNAVLAWPVDWSLHSGISTLGTVP